MAQAVWEVISLYQIGDRVVYPMHGAGIIEGIENSIILGKSQQYYVLRMPIGDLRVMVPVENTLNIGFRYVIDIESIDGIFKILHDFTDEQASNWNKRYRENMLRLKSGDICEVAKVVKTLMVRDRERGLSTGERKMLVSSKQILFSELVLASGKQDEIIERAVEEAIFETA
jgi:CarD family transcriptional regulator